MRIEQPRVTLTIDAARAGPLLRLGAELQATVRPSGDGQLLLELQDGQLLAPRSSVPLRPGDQLQLRVTQLQPATVLQILSTRQPDSPLQAGLRVLLSSAGSRTELGTGFTQLLAILASDPPPSALRPLLAAIAAQVRQPSQLADPAALAAALRDSGLFLERHLSGEAAPPPEQDLKAQLLRLAAQLQAMAQPRTEASVADSSLPRLAELAEGLLARLETLQLQAASSQHLDLLFELPVQGQAGLETLQLRIQEERSQASGGGETESGGGLLVRLRFGFADDALGAVLRLAGDTVSVHWWAEQETTATRLQAALPLLAGRLEALGLQVEALHCLAGEPPDIAELAVLRTQGLVDEKV